MQGIPLLVLGPLWVLPWGNAPFHSLGSTTRLPFSVVGTGEPSKSCWDILKDSTSHMTHVFMFATKYGNCTGDR